jgi:regulatory protein YycI of two-component signal transduction system YycFG
MNDEDSYKHHETTYIEVKNKDIQAKMQEVVKASGQDYKVDIDDIVITCVFSGKNAYGARVKNTAYGLSKFKEGKVYLLTVE